jgi:hypothetical protein
MQFYLAFFSAEGPTADGSSKPHDITQDPGLPGLPAQALPLQTGKGNLISISLTAGQALDDVGYRGISFAAPMESGMVTLIHQYFRDGFYPSGSWISSNLFSSSGQLIKVVIWNDARPLNGYPP